MNRSEICRQIERVGIVPVIRARTPELALQAVEAIVAGGITVIEVTMTVPKAVMLVKEVCKRYGQSLLVGAGTVLDPASVTACIDAGAQFIVSPKLDFETIRTAHQLGRPAIPGRADADRDHVGVRCRRRDCQSVSVLRGWRAELHPIHPRTDALGQAASDRGRDPGDCA